uniref:Large ribosomal subunit protein bL34c n=1 Tax=Ishige okamurae TaxID=233772 RepID=A0A8E6D6B5_9PHAE|nr:ribosomal protein L34 [Ishige okamurae]QVJ99629.1 ribosomal protein L34 [Ishige okamurae]WAM64064.1 50S ribosomal protein L34 [Ishige okamurae]
MTKRTLGGTNRKVAMVSGFRARIKNKTGRRIIKNRRRKSRKKLGLV